MSLLSSRNKRVNGTWPKTGKGLYLAIAFIALIGSLTIYLTNIFVVHKPQAKLPAKEIVSQRTETSQTFKNSDGTFKKVFYTGPAHYKDSAGKWQKIDTKIQVKGEKLKAVKAPFKLEFSKDVSKPLKLTVRSQKSEVGSENAISFIPNVPPFSKKVLPFSKGELEGINPSQPPFKKGGNSNLPLSQRGIKGDFHTTVFNNKATYSNIYPQTDLERIVTPTGLKQNYILKEPGHPATFKETLNTSLTTKLEKDGSLGFYNGAKKVAFSPKPYLVDARGKKVDLDYSFPLSQKVLPFSKGELEGINPSQPPFKKGRSLEKRGITLVLALPSLKGLAYPIKVDPTFMYYRSGADADATISLLVPDTNYGSDPYLYVQNAVYHDVPGEYYDHYDPTKVRSLLKYDVGSIPSNYTVTSAKLSLLSGYTMGTWRGRRYVEVNALSDNSWSEATVTWNSFSGGDPFIIQNTAYGSTVVEDPSVDSNGWWIWNVTNHLKYSLSQPDKIAGFLIRHKYDFATNPNTCGCNPYHTGPYAFSTGGIERMASSETTMLKPENNVLINPYPRLEVNYQLSPTTPTLNSLNANTGNRVVANITDNSTTEDDFHFYLSSSPNATDDVVQIATVNKAGTGVANYPLNFAPFASNYYIRVKAHEHGVNLYSDYSNELSVDTSSFFTFAIPGAPTTSLPTASSIKVTIDPSTNSPETTFAILNETTGQYVQADGSLAPMPVYRTFTQWGGVNGVVNIGLNPNSQYTYKVRALNTDGITYSDFSTSANARTLAAAPINGTATTGTDLVDGNFVFLAWEEGNPSSSANGYRIYYRDPVSGIYNPLVDVNTLNYIHLNSLAGSKSLAYRIVALNNLGQESNYLQVTASPFFPPEAPTMLKPLDVSSTSVTWRWLDNTTTEDGFIVHSANHLEVGKVSPNTVSFTESGLLTKASDRYLATNSKIAYQGSWNSASDSNAKYSNDVTNPASAELNFEGTSINWISLNDNSSGMVDVYLDNVHQTTVDLYSANFQPGKAVYSKPNLLYGKHSLKIVLKNAKNPASSGYKATITGFDVEGNDPIYKRHIHAFNAAGEGSGSAEASYFAGPTGLNAQARSDSNNINVTWNAPPYVPAAYYKVYRSFAPITAVNKWLAIIVADNLTTRDFTDTQTFPGSTYYYQVTAVNAAGLESAISTEAISDHATAGEPAGALPLLPAEPPFLEGLRLWLPFSEGSGLTAADGSGNNNNGIINGSIWVAQNSPAGTFSLKFDGIDDKVTVPFSSSLDIRAPFTVQAWVKADNPNEAAPQRIIAAEGYLFKIVKESWGGIKASVWTDSGGVWSDTDGDTVNDRYTATPVENSLVSNSSLQVNKWRKVKIKVTQTNNFELYIDNVLDSQTALTNPLVGNSLTRDVGGNSVNPVAMGVGFNGQAIDNSNQAWQGQIDNVVVHADPDIVSGLNPPILNSLTTDGNPKNIVVNFTDQSTVEDDFHFYVSENAEPTTDNSQLISADSLGIGSSFNYTITNLKPFTKYYVRIRAHNHSANSFSAPSSIMSVTTPPPPSLSVEPPTVDEMLRGYWPINEGTGTTTADSSTNNNTATINGAQWSTDSVDGNGSLSFDGVDDTVTVPFSQSLDIRGPFSFQAWFKTSSNRLEVVAQEGRLFQILVRNDGGSGTNFLSASVGVEDSSAAGDINGDGIVDMVQADGYMHSLNGYAPVAPGLWHKVQLKYTLAGFIELYLDDLLQASEDILGKPLLGSTRFRDGANNITGDFMGIGDPYPLAIGWDSGAPTSAQPFTGEIDNVKISFIGDKNLRGWWPINWDSPIGEVADFSGNNNYGQPYGNFDYGPNSFMLVPAPNSPYGGQALQFDGVDDKVTIPFSKSLDIRGPFTFETWFKADAVQSSTIASEGYLLGSPFGITLRGSTTLNKLWVASELYVTDETLVSCESIYGPGYPNCYYKNPMYAEVLGGVSDDEWFGGGSLNPVLLDPGTWHKVKYKYSEPVPGTGRWELYVDDILTDDYERAGMILIGNSEHVDGEGNSIGNPSPLTLGYITSDEGVTGFNFFQGQMDDIKLSVQGTATAPTLTLTAPTLNSLNLNETTPAKMKANVTDNSEGEDDFHFYMSGNAEPTTEHSTAISLESLLTGASFDHLIENLEPSTKYYVRVRAHNHTTGEFSPFSQALFLITPPRASITIGATWHFDEGTGLVASDSSDSGNDGILTNGVNWSSNSSGGPFSVNLDGVNDHVLVKDNQSLWLETIVIEANAWLNPGATDGTIISKGISGKYYACCTTETPVGYLSSFALRVVGSKAAFLVGDDVVANYWPGNPGGSNIYGGQNPETANLNNTSYSGGYQVRDPDVFPTSRWVKLTGIYDPWIKTLSIFTDGVLKRQQVIGTRWPRDFTGIKYDSHPIAIGASSTGDGITGGYWLGLIDEVKVNGTLVSALAPYNLRFTNRTSNTVDLAWDFIPLSAVTGFKVYRNGQLIGNTTANVTTFTDTGLTPKTAYEYYVKAVDLQGRLTKPSNTIQVTTLWPPPSMPHGNFTFDTALCTLCHRSHTAVGIGLTVKQVERKLCYTCHDGSGSNFNVLAQFGELPDSPVSHHPVPEGNLVCTNCHDPHKSPTLFPRILGARVNRQSTADRPSFGNAVCGVCHGANSPLPGKAGEDHLTNFTGSRHDLGLADPPSGTRIKCINCHNQHASDAKPLLQTVIKDYLTGLPTAISKNNNDVCYSCHTKAITGAAYNGRNIYQQTKHGGSVDSLILNKYIDQNSYVYLMAKSKRYQLTVSNISVRYLFTDASGPAYEVSWTTNKPTPPWLEYNGNIATYDSSTGTASTTSHQIGLWGEPISYRVRAMDTFGNTVYSSYNPAPQDLFAALDPNGNLNTNAVSLEVAGRTYTIADAGSGAWQSSFESTPQSPGTVATAQQKAAIASVDDIRWETSLATTDGAFDYQMYRFKPNVFQALDLDIKATWAGFGETEYDGTSFYIYNNSSEIRNWELLETKYLTAATEGTLSGIRNRLAVNKKLGYDAGQCLNCHNPHGTPNTDYLRLSLTGNTLCYDCHDDTSLPPKPATYAYQGKAKYESSSAHATPTDNRLIWSIIGDVGGAVGTGGAQPGMCINCHNVHGKDSGSGTPNPKLTNRFEEDLCFNCHNDPAKSASGVNIYQKFNEPPTSMYYGYAQLLRHNVKDIDQQEMPYRSAIKVECESCHNPHLNKAQAPVISPNNKSQLYTSTMIDPKTGNQIFDYQGFCLTCHSSFYVIWSNSFGPHVNKVNYQNDYHGGKNSDGFTDLGFIGNGTIMGGATVPQFTGSSVTSYGFLKPPYTRGMGPLPCSDCHDSHGSSWPFRLKEVVNGNRWDRVNSETGNFCESCHYSSTIATVHATYLNNLVEPYDPNTNNGDCGKNAGGGCHYNVTVDYSSPRCYFGCHTVRFHNDNEGKSIYGQVAPPWPYSGIME